MKNLVREAQEKYETLTNHELDWFRFFWGTRRLKIKAGVIEWQDVLRLEVSPTVSFEELLTRLKNEAEELRLADAKSATRKAVQHLFLFSNPVNHVVNYLDDSVMAVDLHWTKGKIFSRKGGTKRGPLNVVIDRFHKGGGATGQLAVESILTENVLLLWINWNAPKGQILNEVDNLLTEHIQPFDSPWWAKRRLGAGDWDTLYEVYDLHEKGHTLEEIAATVGKPYKTVHRLLKIAWELAHQKERGTKRQRRQESGDEYPYHPENDGWGPWLQYKGVPSLEDAERELASTGLVGGSGCRRTPSHIKTRYDEGGSFFNPAATEGWPSPPDWHKNCSKCRFLPGSEGCSTCSQEQTPGYYIGGLLENKEPYEPSAYTKRFIFPPTFPGTGKKTYPDYHSEWRHLRIDEQIEFGLPREEDLALQAKYIEQNGVTLSRERPLRVAKNFGPRWGWEIAYWPTHKLPCVECVSLTQCRGDDSLCDAILKWTKKISKTPTLKIDTRKYAHLLGQYSLAFTMRSDLLEELLIGQIESRREPHLFEKSIYRRNGNRSEFY